MIFDRLLLIPLTHISIVLLFANHLHVVVINATKHRILLEKFCKIGTQTMHRAEYQMQTLSKSDRNKYHRFSTKNKPKNWSNYMHSIFGIFISKFPCNTHEQYSRFQQHEYSSSFWIIKNLCAFLPRNEFVLSLQLECII